MDENGADQGLDRLEQLLAADPTSEQFAELAEAYVAAGRVAEALEICERGLGFHPDRPAGHLAYARALLAEERLDEAIGALERACALEPRNAAVHGRAGAVLADRGQYPAAVPYLQKGLRLDEYDPWVGRLKQQLEVGLGEPFERIATGQFNREPVAAAAEPEAAAEAGAGESLDEDDDEDEPPTVYETNPLARHRAGGSAEQAGGGDASDRGDQATEFDDAAGLRASVSHAVDSVGGDAGEPPTHFDAAAEDRAIAEPDRGQPPTVMHDGGPAAAQPADAVPWADSGRTQAAGPGEPPTLYADGASPPPGSEPAAAAPPDATRPSQSRPRGPMFADPAPQPAPATSISYWKVFLVVVPFLLVAVAGGLYFGFRHLHNEKVAGLLEQSLGAMGQDTFAGYSDARQTLQRLLELEPEHVAARALLAMVAARLHDEYGPNAELREEAEHLLAALGQQPDLGQRAAVSLLWARYHVTPRDERQPLAEPLAAARERWPEDPRLTALTGELAVLRGDLDAGTRWLEQSLKRDPSNPRTLAALAELEMQSERWRLAGEHLVRALAINAVHVRSLLALARLRIERGRELGRAGEELERVLELPEVTDRRRSEAHLLYADWSFQRDQRTRALAAVKAASDLRPDDLAFQRRLAELCLEFNELDEAADHARRLMELDPDDISPRLLLVATQLPRGQHRAALETLGELVGKEVPAAPFLLLRGRALLAAGRPETSLADLQSVPENSDEKVAARAFAVLAHLAAEDRRSARSAALALQRQHPDQPLAHYAMGQYRETRGLLRGAAAAYEKAIEIDPRCFRAHRALAAIHAQRGKIELARESIAAALRANPFDAASHMLRGRVELAGDAPQAALHAFARVAEDNPGNGEALMGMAEALLELGDLDKALKAVRKARRAGADDPHSRHVQGRVLMANGRFHRAIRALTAADEAQPRDPAILADLGLALLGVRSLRRAEEAFEQSLRLARKWQRLPRAQEGLAKVLLAKRKYDDAARAFARAALYARGDEAPKAEVVRLYLAAGRAMLRDKRAGDKRYARARYYFAKAVKHAPEDDPEPLYELAAAYDRQQRLRPARKVYEKVLEKDPQHQLTLYRLGLLEFDDNKDQRAKELLTRFLETKPRGRLVRMARKVLRRID